MSEAKENQSADGESFGEAVQESNAKLHPPTNAQIAVHKAITEYQNLSASANLIRDITHSSAVAGGWWHDAKTGEPLARNTGEILCLMHSEISEAMEADRKDLMDSHLPHRHGVEVEMADLIIRAMDFCGAKGYNIGNAIAEKLAYNQVRADHKPENRLKEGGKKY